MKKRLFRLLISFAILFIVIYNTHFNFSSVFTSIKKPFYLIYAITIPLLISPYISNNRWKIFLSAQGINESFFSLVKINFVSIFLGILLPSTTGFDAIRIYIIEKRNNQKPGNGGASVIMERMLGFYILSIIGIVGSLYAIKHGMSKTILYSILGINIFIILVFWIIKNHIFYIKLNILLSKINKYKLYRNYFASLYGSLNSFPLSKILYSTVPLIILFQLSNILCGVIILKAFDIDVPFLFNLAFLPLISIISIIPISISGLGLREGGFVYFYGLLGIEANVCFLISLLYYFIIIIIPAIIGFLFYFFGPDQFKSIKNELVLKNDE